MNPNVAASVKDRLLNRARGPGEEFERTLARFASERVLYRLGMSSARDRCLLKGASLLAVWLPEPYRATRDIDLLASGPSDEAAIRSLLEEICAVQCPEDGLRFSLDDLRIDPIRADEEHAGKRARFFANLGTARIRVQIDFGFGDSLGAEPESVEYPTLLAELPAPRLRAYPREAAVAEKFEAMVKLDIRNSRMKDFHDVWALAGAFSFDGATLRRAVVECFARRGTPLRDELPRALSPAFYEDVDLRSRWTGYLQSGDLVTPPPAQFELIGEQVILFLGPVRRSIALSEPFAFRWPPGGSWA